jgi:outer membrane protein
MTRFRFVTFYLFVSTFLALTAYAQVPSAPPKIAFIDTGVFYDEKLGITRLVTSSKQVDAEFAARFKELQDGSTKLQSIAKELDTMQKLPQAQFNQTAYTSKQEEGERLQRELNYKKTEYEAAYTKRRNELVAPVSQDIGKAIDEFAKKNGYGIILDVAKLSSAGAVLYYAEVADSTKEFIAFYNARPATPTK